MRKSNIWLACGLLSAFGVWQLSAVAQQPETKSRPGASQDDLSEQIQTLTEQTSKLLELTAQLDGSSDSDGGDASKEIRRTRDRLADQLKALEKQVQHLSAEKGRSDAQRRNADAEHKHAEAAKKHAEDAAKHAIEIRRRSIEDVRKGGHQGNMKFSGPGPRFAGQDVRELVKGLPGQNFIFRSEVHGPQSRSPEDTKRLEEFKLLVKQYRDEKDGDHKQELRNSIREKLTQQVDRDMDARREELSDLESRVENLRGQLEKSEGSKDEAIESLLRMLDGDEDIKPLTPEWMDVLSANGGPRGPWNANFSHDWNFQNIPSPVIATFRGNHAPDQAPDRQNALDVVVATEYPIEHAIRVPIAPAAPPVPVDPFDGVAPVAPVPPVEPTEPLAEIEEDIEVHVDEVP